MSFCASISLLNILLIVIFRQGCLFLFCSFHSLNDGIEEMPEWTVVCKSFPMKTRVSKKIEKFVLNSISDDIRVDQVEVFDDRKFSGNILSS